VVLRYRDGCTARVVTEAVSPDNYQVPYGIEVTVEVAGAEVKASVRCARMGSLISTLDDLLSCVGAAEKAVGVVS
jgi:hypothetical protein